jgi:periplasmic copper chaperone A
MGTVSSVFAAAVLGLALVGACSPPAPQAGASAPPVISNAWAAVTPGGAKVGAGYLTVTNPGAQDDHLVSASSPRAAHVEIHDMKMEGDMMTMHSMDEGLVVPAGKSAALKPGGGHLMFIDITTPFVAGETIPVTLTFEHAGAIEAQLPVRPIGAADGEQ